MLEDSASLPWRPLPPYQFPLLLEDLRRPDRCPKKNGENEPHVAQRMEEARKAYAAGIEWMTGLKDRSRHVETDVAATAALDLYSQFALDGKIKNFRVPDFTFHALQRAIRKFEASMTFKVVSAVESSTFLHR